MPTADMRSVRRGARASDGSPRGTAGSSRSEDDVLCGRDPMESLWVLALGHILFRCPNTVMANVNHWMSWRIFNHESEGGMSCEEAFDRLLYAVLNDGVDLQVKMRRVEDRRMATTRISYELSTMYNPQSHRLSDFACSENVLLAAARGRHDGEAAEMRLRAVLVYMFAGTERKFFSHVEESPDGNAACHRNFTENRLLEWCLDHSVAFVAIGLYIATYIKQADEAADAEPDARLSLARLEAARQTMAIYENFIEALNEKCSRLSRLRISLPEELSEYRHEQSRDGEEEEGTFFCGVPLAVAQNEVLTLLWFKRVWQERVQRGDVPILDLVRDLWWAKSAVMLERYRDFFEVDPNFDRHLLAVTENLRDEEKGD